MPRAFLSSRVLLSQQVPCPRQPSQPVHEHVWKEHTATTQTWIPNIVVVEDYGELSSRVLLSQQVPCPRQVLLPRQAPCMRNKKMFLPVVLLATAMLFSGGCGRQSEPVSAEPTGTVKEVDTEESRIGSEAEFL